MDGIEYNWSANFVSLGAPALSVQVLSGSQISLGIIVIGDILLSQINRTFTICERVEVNCIN